MKPVARAAAPAPPVVAPAADERARLRTLARQLEGVFVAQLFKAMRESVPRGGLTDGGSGGEMFTAMLDEKVADQAAARMNDHLGEALVRQLAHRLSAAGDGGHTARTREAAPIPLVCDRGRTTPPSEAR
jgi:peptidoglycan hydrolase FlgJ